MLLSDDVIDCSDGIVNSSLALGDIMSDVSIRHNLFKTRHFVDVLIATFFLKVGDKLLFIELM